ncbi:MAG: hypothetical protein F6J93_00850 [Oscillatoria sp. SIO1A7]|nr:hypothetical protein [Oscillatoria sp. SIO1A7]
MWGNFILFPDRFRELESPTGTLDSGFNWERSRLSKKTVTTPQSQHPTPRVLTLWGKRKGGFHAVFVSPSEGAKILAVIGFRDFRTAAIPAGRQCAEKTSESTPYPTPNPSQEGN